MTAPRKPDAARGAVSPPPPAFAALFPLIGDKLASVERELQTNFGSEFHPIAEAGRYLAEGGGKRLRPALVLLSSGLVGYEGDEDVLLGAVFELIHTATLVHDDIIDEAELRRGRAAANQVFGNEFTVLIGDYLYLRSINMALRTRRLRVIDALALSTERMIEGELLAHHLRGREDVTAEQHMAIVERKTAWLFSACCRSAGILGGVAPETEEDLAAFGMEFGIAFQIVDDLLDVTSDEKTVGKPVASDLREGRLTLPWIDLLECGNARERQAVLDVLRGDGVAGDSFEMLREALAHRGCLARARQVAELHASRARAIMERFAPNAYRDVLLDLPSAVLARDR
ncbi:MAG: polyprenyl synthetase family protein [Acidobacteria bacterium]|nr:polyprenyl synthetase family protein [Acidobacteriota bacterium]